MTFRREYWRAFSDAVKGPMLAANANARIDLIHNALLAQGLNSTGIAAVKTYMADRRAYIVSQLATVAAAFTVAGPENFSTAASTLSLSGTAPVDAASIEVNGLAIFPVWSSVTGWSAGYLLTARWRSRIHALNGAGETLGSTVLTVNYTGTASWPALRLNEWMASNDSYLDPADSDADDWLEIFNPSGAPVDLSNWRLSDNNTVPAKFIIPADTASLRVAGSSYGPMMRPPRTLPGNPQLHAGFKLSATGGSILLSAPDGTLVDAVAFGRQSADRTEGRYPDGTPGSLRTQPAHSRHCKRAHAVYGTESHRGHGHDDVYHDSWAALRDRIQQRSGNMAAAGQ